MKKSSFRAFGTAFFLIGAIMVIGEKFQLPFLSTESSSDQEEMTKLEQQLSAAKKQITILEETIETESVSNELELESDNEQSNVHTKKDTDVSTKTLYIYDGLTLSDIAQKLKDLGIIKNSVEMELFLAQKDYAKSIQIGQFELNSNMTVEEIANIITGKE